MIKQTNPELGYWMSEYCILQENDEIARGHGRDLSMKTALYVARVLHHDMVLTNAKSWQWWTAISQVDFKDGLVYLDDGSEGESGRMGGNIESLRYNGEVRESKLLWVLGNYSRFVRPGMVRGKCELSEEERKAHMGEEGSVSTYITDKSRNMGYLSQHANAIILPPRSVVTVVQ